jgi:ElaB/YqjD/DUF883 family membrane-anchored ribosome-binding protein
MKSSTGNPSGAQSADELIANISKLMAEAEEMLSESHPPHSLEHLQLRRRWQSAGARFVQGYDTAKAKLCAVAKSTDTAIRRYPYESVAIALGVGIGLGALFFHRRR